MSVIRPLDIRYPFSVATEPITLAEAKAWLQIDFSDWDTLLTNELIPAARNESEKASGMLYVERNVVITDNKLSYRIYPIGPWVADVTTDETEVENYTYTAGFNNANPLPQDLHVAMLKKDCNGFCI
jgi:hypothetical protein